VDRQNGGGKIQALDGAPVSLVHEDQLPAAQISK